MRRLLIAVLLFATTAWAQGAKYENEVKNQYGKPISGAQVRICAPVQPPSPTALCETLATLYSSETLTVAIPDPITVTNGNYSFWAAPGNYWRQIVVAGRVVDSQKITVTASKEYVDANGGGASATADNAWTGSNTFSNIKISGASGSRCLHTDATGKITETAGDCGVGGSVNGQDISPNSVTANTISAETTVYSNKVCLGVAGGVVNEAQCRTSWSSGSGSGTPSLTEDGTAVTSAKKFKAPSVEIGSGAPTVINVTGQTVSQLPTSNNTLGDQRQVSDAVSATDCTVGSGTVVHWCRWNGSAWTSSLATGLTPAGSSGDLQTNNGSGGLGSVAQSAFAKVIAKGRVALSTGAIASGACASTITATATASDPEGPNYDRAVTTLITDPSAVTGYGATTGSLTVYFWLTANTFNIRQCNWTSSSITPGAASVNWAVVR